MADIGRLNNLYNQYGLVMTDEYGYIQDKYLRDEPPPHGRPRQPVQREYRLSQYVHHGSDWTKDTVYHVQMKRRKSIWVVVDKLNGKVYQVHELYKGHWQLDGRIILK